MKKALIYVGNAIVIVAATAAGHIIGEKIMEKINEKYAEKRAKEDEENAKREENKPGKEGK